MSDWTKQVMIALVLVAGCGETPPPYPKSKPGSEDVGTSTGPQSQVGGPVGVPGAASGGTGGGTVATNPVEAATPGSAPVTGKPGQPAPPILAGLGRMPGYRASLSVVNPSSGNSDEVARGYNLYTAKCAMCHGTDLKGPQSVSASHVQRSARDLSLPANYRYGSTDQAIYRTIRYGIPRTAMGNYEKLLKEEQVWDLVNFLKSRWRRDAIAPAKPPYVH